jgi:hypothetical protein
MRYALRPSEKAFKEALGEFACRAIAGTGAGRPPDPDVSGLLCRELRIWLSAFKPAGLSRVEEAVALEEIVRRFPESGPGLVASGLFQALSPRLCQAAADLGAAQGILAPDLAELVSPEGSARPVFQALSDALSGIEAARLKLYRAAILEDSDKRDAEESDGAGRLAGALVREALDLNERIKRGGKDESGSAVQKGDHDGHRQRPEGPGGDPQASRS